MLLKYTTQLNALFSLLTKQGIEHSNIVNIYLFGSQVYNTFNKFSDYDFVVILNNNFEEGLEIKENLLNIHLYSFEYAQSELLKHNVKFLELYFLPDDFKIENKKFFFELNLSLLRKNISSTSNNSWVKCKKKLTVEENQYYIGIKSLFHSFRILDLGIQIAKNKTIDFSSKNYIWFSLLHHKNKLLWEDIYNEYKQDYNLLASEFKKIAPK